MVSTAKIVSSKKKKRSHKEASSQSRAKKLKLKSGACPRPSNESNESSDETRVSDVFIVCVCVRQERQENNVSKLLPQTQQNNLSCSLQVFLVPVRLLLEGCFGICYLTETAKNTGEFVGAVTRLDRDMLLGAGRRRTYKRKNLHVTRLGNLQEWPNVAGHMRVVPSIPTTMTRMMSVLQMRTMNDSGT